LQYLKLAGRGEKKECEKAVEEAFELLKFLEEELKENIYVL
jgi:hypothetical protein